MLWIGSALLASRQHNYWVLKVAHMTIIDTNLVRNQLFASNIHKSKDGNLPVNVTKLLCPASFKELLPNIDTIIFDADGVLWLGNDVIPGSPGLVDFLIESNKQVIILTNNATKSRAVYARKLAGLGFNPKLDKGSLVNPAAVVADELYRAGIVGDKMVYLIGAQGVRDEMDALGIRYFGHGLEPRDDSDGSAFIFDLDLEVEPCDVGAVVVGYEKHFDYHKLQKAANYLQHPHCLFLATNEDETCPGPNPDFITPDAGPIVAAVRCASGREPITVGKPNTPAFDYIKRRWRINPGRTMMVGDRTNTDVKFGRDHGLKTLLVFSGCHQLKDIAENRMHGHFDMVPDFCAPCLGALMASRARA
ncbi:phosphoglycolate/pyridoxal phosphate phosphatase family protein [Teladorsagia circumcincta]|uniref:Phosphoglycolate/pyridoxal phosphate phosphatase family protein n=1 Tax=Teladorsagia circumcincta TaxID=45464 RepID=A0A2G9V5Y3_TELCI|nr:phosphoglycolate/pyridoxal phosphate phosphatase family protein [Teladorsagia circumcincta]